MKLNYLITCNNAFGDEDGRLNIIQTFDVIKAKNFPAIYPHMSIVAKWNLENDNEKKNTHKLKLTVQEEGQGKKIVDMGEKELKAEKDKNDYLQFILNITNIQFNKEGMYSINTSLDGKAYKKAGVIRVVLESS